LSILDNFKIPFAESCEWDKNVGTIEISRLNLCGKTIRSKGNVYQHKKDMLLESGFLSSNDYLWLTENIEEPMWMSTYCVKEAGHTGPCSCNPYLPKGKDKISKGIEQKLKDPLTNPGDDPKKGANRSHKRNFPLAFDKNERARWYEYNKETGFRKELSNIALRLPMVSSPLMMGLAYIDMFACIWHSKDARQHLEVPTEFETILHHRWQELKEFYASKRLRIYNDNDQLQDPILWETIEVDWYGKGHEDLKGIQFGHVDPISEDKWMTRPYNVLPITRETNLNQSSASLYDVMNRMRESVRLQDAWEESL
jgi:hypothetical protein